MLTTAKKVRVTAKLLYFVLSLVESKHNRECLIYTIGNQGMTVSIKADDKNGHELCNI